MEAGAGAAGRGGETRRETARGELARSAPPDERDRTGTRGPRAAAAMALSRVAVPALRPRLVHFGPSDPPGQSAAGQESFGWTRPGEDGRCRCPTASALRHASRPRHLPAGEETLTHQHAAGTAYLISRHAPTNLASLLGWQVSPGLETQLGRGRTPGTPPSEPRALSRAPLPSALEARPAS